MTMLVDDPETHEKAWFCNTCKRMFEQQEAPPAIGGVIVGSLGIDESKHQCRSCVDRHNKVVAYREEAKRRRLIYLSYLRGDHGA